MKAKKSSYSILSHVGLKAGGIGVAQIHQDQTVQNVGEVFVHIESEQLPAEFEVLAQQDRKTFAVALDFGDGSRHLFHVEQIADGPHLPVGQRTGSERSPGPDPLRKRIPSLALKELKEKLA